MLEHERQVCAWWVLPLLLAIAAAALLLGAMWIPRSTLGECVFGLGVVCGFFAVRSCWVNAPEVAR